MPIYDVKLPEGCRRLRQLAYASGVLAILRQDDGTAAMLSEAGWRNTVAHEQVVGCGAAELWETAFYHGYRDAQQRRAEGRGLCRELGSGDPAGDGLALAYDAGD